MTRFTPPRISKNLIACELIKLAKAVKADGEDYRYDPEHKHKPTGGGWQKTEKGWTQSKQEGGHRNDGESGNGGADDERLTQARTAIWNQAQSRDEQARCAAARNPLIDEGTLAQLAMDKSQQVRINAARNHSNTQYTSKLLAQDRNPNVRLALAENLFTPPSTLRMLDYDSNEPYENISMRATAIEGAQEEIANFKKTLGMQNHRGRNLQQLQADFLKNMDPSAYESPKAFAYAQERIKKLSPADFGLLLKAFAEEEQP